MSGHAAPAFSMGKLKREKETRNDRDFKQIGPGSYTVSMADKKKEPAFSMGARTKIEQNKLNVPGAGSYVPPSKIVESQGKTFGVAIELKKPEGKLGPGPGGYNVDKKKVHDISYS